MTETWIFFTLQMVLLLKFRFTAVFLFIWVSLFSASDGLQDRIKSPPDMMMFKSISSLNYLLAFCVGCVWLSCVGLKTQEKAEAQDEEVPAGPAEASWCFRELMRNELCLHGPGYEDNWILDSGVLVGLGVLRRLKGGCPLWVVYYGPKSTSGSLLGCFVMVSIVKVF